MKKYLLLLVLVLTVSVVSAQGGSMHTPNTLGSVVYPDMTLGELGQAMFDAAAWNSGTLVGMAEALWSWLVN